MEKSVKNQIRQRKTRVLAVLLVLSVGLIAANLGALLPPYLGGLPTLVGAFGASQSLVRLLIS